jgi:hypothetical protein
VVLVNDAGSGGLTYFSDTCGLYILMSAYR